MQYFNISRCSFLLIGKVKLMYFPRPPLKNKIRRAAVFASTIDNRKPSMPNLNTTKSMMFERTVTIVWITPTIPINFILLMPRVN